MTTTPKVLLKRSSVAGRIPADSDLDYGELAVNFADGKLYYKNNSNQVKAFIDSARVQEIADAVEVVAQAQLDSSEVTDLIDSAYVQTLIPLSYLEGLIDSSYINARSDHYTGFDSDFGTKTTDNLTEGSTNLYYTKARADSDIAASLTDSGNTVSITINNTIIDTVDSAYVLARANEAGIDSAEVIALIDSAYIRARQEDLQRDSAFITNIVTNNYIQSAADSNYIKTVGGIDADKLDGQHGNYYLDWNNTTNKPTILDLVDVSTQITADVDKAFVDALNVDADTLDGQQGTYYLDYNNFTNTPAIQESADVVGIVDSAYVRARVRTNQDLYTTSTVTFNQINGPENFIIDPATVGDNTGTVQILGNLQVEGTQTTINSTTVSINDKNIVLADSAANAAAADGAGITIDGANATMQYSASGDKFVFNKPIEGEYLGFDSDFGTKTTDDLTEGSTNLYYTTTRHNSDTLAQVDSAYVRARVRTDQDLRTTDSVTFGGLAVTDNRIHWGESDAYMEYLPDSDAIFFNKPVKVDAEATFTSATVGTDSGTFTGLYVYDARLNGINNRDWVARFSRKTNEFASAATVLISNDGEERSDIAFEVRGNIQGNLVNDQTSFRDDPNTDFVIFGSGHTLIGYNNIPNTASYQMLAGDNEVKLQVAHGISVDSNLVIHAGNYTSYIDSAYIEARRPPETIFDVTNNGASAYTFSGEGFSSSRDNPTLYLVRGKTYKFNMSASGHPFEIRVSNGGSAYSTGVTNNGAQTGVIFFTPDMNAPSSLVYQCTVHSGMVGDIVILDGTGSGGLDSAAIIELIDSAYVQAREAAGGGGVDSAATQAMIDSNFLNRSGHLIPALDSTYDIGTASKKWKDLYLSGNTIYLGGHNIHRQGNAMRFIDSNGALIDLVAANLIDSNTVTTIVDSAYILARSTGGGAGTLDSGLTSQLVDSAYVKLRVDYNGNEKLTFGNDQSQSGTLTATSTQVHSHGAGNHPPNSQFNSSYNYATGGIPIGQWVYAYYTFGNSAIGYGKILSKVDNGASAGTYTYYTTYIDWANGWTNVVVLANNIGQRDKGMSIQHETNADEIQFTSFRNFHFTQNDSDGRNFKIELVGDSASLDLVGGKNIHYGSRYDHAGQFPDASIYTGMIAYSAANNSLYYANDSGTWQVIEGTGDPTFDDSNFIEQMLDSAYILGKKFVPGDAERRIDIRSTEPIKQHAIGDYWLDRDNEVLYKLSAANNWTSAFPSYTYAGYPNMSTFDFGSHTTASSQSFNINQPSGPSGTFTATWKTGGTTGNYTGFEATFNNPVIFGYYYIANTVSAWVHRVDYEDGSYAQSNQSNARNQPDSITWYEANGTAMSGADAKTFSVPNSGVQTQNWLHPRGEKAVSLVFGRGTYGTRNYDAYLFFNGDNFYQRVGEIYDSGDIKTLIDSNYITQYSGSGSGTVDSAATITLINAALDSAAIPFTQTFFHFTADSGQLTFSGFDDDSDTLAYTAGALAVYLNGILLVDSADYTATDGSSVVLFDSASAGDVLSVMKFQGNSNVIGGSGTIDSAYFQNVTGNIIPALDSTYDLGSTTKKWKELHLSGNTIFLGGHRIRKVGSSIAFTDSAGSNLSLTASNIPDAEAVFNVVNNGAGAYTFSGDGFSSSRDNPTLYLQRGLTYKFSVNAAGHPFQIRVSSGGSAYNNGVTNNGTQEGDVYFTPDMNAPKNLVYQCTNHSGMLGSIVIIDNNSFLDSAATTALVDSAYIQLRDRFQEDSNFVTNIVDSSYIQARVTASANIDSIGAIGNVNAIGAAEGQILKFDSASQKFILASDATGGGGGGSGTVDSAQTISLIEATVDSDYIGTKVDFTRGEFVNEKSQYTATAAQSVFNHSSIDPTHLDVYLNGVLQVVNDDYTANTSAVTFTAGVDSGYSVTIVEKRGRVATQRGLVESKYYFTTPTPITAITGTDDNGITLDYSDGFLDVYLNGILLKDSDDYSTNAGTTVTLVSATDSNDLVTLINRKGIVVTPNVKNYEFTATAGQTTFSGADINGNTLAYVPGAAQVFLNGILLRNVDYTGITGTSIVLVDSASLNDELVVSAFSNPGQNMDLYKFTADSGQTIFSGNDLSNASLAYQPGNIQVFMNGLLLNDSDDYTASNGMSVVLTDGADASDEIKIASFVSNTDVIRTNAWTAPSGTPVTATAGDKLFIDTSSAKTVTLPSSASMGDEIRIIDVTGNASSNNITLSRNGHNIQGAASDLTINVDRAGIGLVYYNSAQGWVLIEN